MEEIKKKFDKKFWIVIIMVILIWISLFWYMFTYGESVRKDPCSVCSERMGEEVICYFGKVMNYKIQYFPNGTIDKP